MGTKLDGNRRLSSFSSILKTHFRSLKSPDLRNDPVAQFEKVVQIRCRSRHLTVTEAFTYLDSILEMKPLPSSRTLNHLFGSLLKLNQSYAVVSMYTRLASLRFHEFEPDVSTLNIVIKCLCQLRYMKLGFSVLGASLKRGLGYDQHTMSSLLDGLCRDGSIADASELFEKIADEDGLCNEAVYGTMINGFCKAEESHRALKLFKRMLEIDGIKPDIYSFNLIIDCLCRGGLVDEALTVFGGMSGFDVRADVISYNCLISGFCKSGKWKEVARVLKNMKVEGVSPSIATFNSILDARFKEGSTIVALQLLAVMGEKRILPEHIASSSFLEGLDHSAESEEAKVLFDNMESSIIVANAYTLSIILNGLSGAYMMVEAQKLFEEMLELGQVNTVTFTTMINGYCLISEMEKAKEMFDRMEASGVVPNTVTYNTLANGYLRVQRVVDAVMILDDLIAKGLRPDEATQCIFKSLAWSLNVK